MQRLTVLYDAQCSLCGRAREWLERQPTYLALEFVAAGSAEAQARWPQLNPARTLRELTVVADTGEIYVDDAAWLMCLWALREHRSHADRLAAPALRPLARRFVHWVSDNRPTTSRPCEGDCPA
jgi:predicted DCC family thiol-disulfide oxidoreductase YuxK